MPSLPGGERIGEIVGRHHLGELFALDQQPVCDRHVEAAGDGGDDRADGERRIAHDAAGQVAGGGHQLLMGDDVIDEPHLPRAFRRKILPRQQQFECALAAGKPRQALGAAEGRRHAELDLRLGKARPVTGDRQMHGLGDLAAAAEGEPVDRGDDRLRKGFEPRRQPLAAADEIAHSRVYARSHAFRELVDIAACGKGTVAGAGDDHRADSVVHFDRVEKDHEPVDQLIVQRVEFLRAVEDEQGGPLGNLHQYGLGHGRSPARVDGERLGERRCDVYSLVGILERWRKQRNQRGM
ncbi:hypothetical protein D9M70_429680 [compost metagenome]